MAVDLKNMDATTFCDLQGVNDTDRITLMRMHGAKTLSYEQWHKLTSKEFVSVGEKKSFETKKDK